MRAREFKLVAVHLTATGVANDLQIVHIAPLKAGIHGVIFVIVKACMQFFIISQRGTSHGNR